VKLSKFLVAAIVAWLALLPVSTLTATLNVEVHMGTSIGHVAKEASKDRSARCKGRPQKPSKEARRPTAAWGQVAWFGLVSGKLGQDLVAVEGDAVRFVGFRYSGRTDSTTWKQQES